MCYPDFGESRDKWRIVFYRYLIKSGFKRRGRNAFIQGGYNETPTNTERTITYPVAFSSIIGAWIAEIAYRADSDWGELTCKPNNTQLVYHQNGRSTGAYWYAIGV